ncbi:hypothetical protein BBK82_43080 [Lentzea guizhouensis]|uniref:Peptidase inhibitor n=1 Tax=Lentzea guizhouensis TaxID=1586287 RepID=A0A1B2HVG6_9PSEU|nr:peptidase inhibitor family I36 protein [Lentzea guizhouensis]ANZ41729.1 hypothetical protein BBK82_43080 [Lentzea guizhouensis]
MNWIRSLVIAFGLMMVAVTAPAAGAQAPDSQRTVEPLAWSQCPDGYFCVWENADGTGRFARFQLGSPNLAVPIGGYVFNDEISAVWNRTNRIWCLYEHAHYGGRLLRIAADWRGPIGPRYDFNDIVSSLRPC